MACNLCRYLLTISSLLIVTMSQSTPTCTNPSPPPSSHVNIFEEVLVTEPTVVEERLVGAPFVQGMDTSTPAYQFTGHGTGVAFTSLSNKIREASCRHNEVTFSGRVFIRDSQSDGPLIELSYGDATYHGQVMYLVIMDAAADEIIIGYRHQGHLRSETISPVRLISGRWREYTITLSGNLLSFYFDCELLVRRVIPLPDYCATNSSVVVNVASSLIGEAEYVGNTGLYIYVQNLGIHFGPGGLQRQCPSLADECTSCGQFLSLLKRVSEAHDRMETLQKRIEELESNSSCITPPTGSPTSTDCLVMDGLHQRIINNGEFMLIPPNRICYCDNGRDTCTNIQDLNVNTPASNCSGPVATTAVPSDPTQPTQPPPGTVCSPPTGVNILVPVGEHRALDIGNGICNVYSCRDDGIFGLNLLTDRRDCAQESRPSDCINLPSRDKELFQCCGLCDACSFKICSNNSKCVLEDDPEVSAVCVCNSGYMMEPGSDVCVDVDECALGLRAEGHNCPLETSICINTEGSFRCGCKEGYILDIRNGIERCVDIDECGMVPSVCPPRSDCTNLPGGFSCSCAPNYAVQRENGTCEPVCEPACLNGGTCISPGNCFCPPQYTGSRCEVDVNECENIHTCPGPRTECVNTIGGHFCRCIQGYQKVNGSCRNVNECDLRINNCVGGAECVDTLGGFRCMCNDVDERGLSQQVDCTGRCVRKGKPYADGTSFRDGCANCTCLGGELTCRRLKCDCNDPELASSNCCSECNRRDCYIKNDTIRIRPGSTWVNPSNRCERYHCLSNLTAVNVGYDGHCPAVDCPKNMQSIPMGKCCPICDYPKCTARLDRRVVSLRNSCETCTCRYNLMDHTGNWTCSTPECPTLECKATDIVFYKNCCPVCRQHVLGTSTPMCPT